MSTRLPLHLNSGETAFLNEKLPEGCSRQDFFRALLKAAHDDSSLLENALARCGEKISPHPDHAPGFHKGYSVDDYRDALEEAGSLAGAGSILGVDRETVREMAVRHEIPVESMGGVPD